MKPVEDTHKSVKTSTTSGPVTCQDENGKGDSDKEKVDFNNNSNKSHDDENNLNHTTDVSSSPPSSSSSITTTLPLENEKPDSTNDYNDKSNNDKGNEPLNKITQKSVARGRKMTTVNLIPCDCKLCGEKFDSDKALGYHIRDVHVVGKKDKKETEPAPKKKPRDYHYVRGKDWKVLNPKRPYCCSICSKRFLYESSLNHHKVVKHNEKIDLGSGGGDDEANGSNGSTSNSTGGNIPPKMYNHTFQCEQCGKILMSKHSLIRHLVSFHGTDHEKPFQCDICGHRYVSISSLVSHRRKEHTGDKPHVCEHCGKAFTMSGRLKCHLRVHSDEKFYKCQQCSKQFKSCSAFRAHKDTHLGVMRHTCKYCERKFLFQGNMIKHIRRRHPNGEKITPTNTTTISLNGINNSNSDNLVFTTEGNHNLNVPSEMNNSGSSLTIQVGGNNGLPSSVINSSMASNSMPVVSNASTINIVSSSRRSSNNHRYHKTPDHSYFTKEMTVNVHSHVDILEQQQQNMQNLSPMDQFVQPEIQFQVLPPNQELFNSINTYQSSNLNQTNSGTNSTSGRGNNNNNGLNQGQTIVNDNNHPRDSRLDFSGSPTPGKCRLCEQSYSDVRFHITDFHRIPSQKVESMMPAMVYF